MFSMERSFYLYISLIMIMKKSNFQSLAFMKGHVYIFYV